ncbi:MAG: DNA repair protein RecO [Candidatus Aminicenantes bacterium]|nr:MAG: DNA repair protein RecO [Candidatus Aminicenantes bacterium]
MPLEQSEAIVLRTFNVGEQDKIVVFFTQDKGVIKGVAKGARKFGNRFGSSLEPMSHVKVFYYEKERRDLVTVSNCDLLESFFEIQNVLKTSFTLSYFSELIEEFFPSRSKEDILFRLLLSTLQALGAGGDSDFLGAYFEAWLLKISGILPNFKTCKKCRKEITEAGWLSPKKDGTFCIHCTPQKKEEIRPELNQFLQWIKKTPPPKKKELPFTPEQLMHIRKTLQAIIIFHMEREPKSLSCLK